MTSIAILTSGGTYGLGHVTRQLVLAKQLRVLGASVEFVSDPKETIGWERIAAAGYDITVTPSYPVADCLIVDEEIYSGRDLMETFRCAYKRVVLVGGVSYPPIPELEPLVDLMIYQGELFDYPATERALNGPEYLIIDPDYVWCNPNPDGHVLVSMGGRDPFGFTAPVVDVVSNMGRKVFVILGPAFNERKSLPSQDNVVIINKPDSLTAYIDGAAMAVVTTGMTAYECLAAGVPCVLYNISEDHERTAARLEEKGVAINMGMTFNEHTNNSNLGLYTFVLSSLASHIPMSRAARKLVDGQGAMRVAKRIMELCR